MKTSIRIATVVLILFSFGYEGCKKGTDDPFLSIYTRKARMTGHWKVSEGKGTDAGINGSADWTYDGTTKTITGTNSSFVTFSYTENASYIYNFEKDGTFKTVTTTTLNSPYNIETETLTGTWELTKKSDDTDKNKDHVAMHVLTHTYANTNPGGSSTTNYSADNAPVNLMYIDELRNKEIILKSTNTSYGSSGQYQVTLIPQ